MKKFILFLTFLSCNIAFCQYTLIPDAGFEQKLISLGFDADNTINGQVLTSDISGITEISLNAGLPLMSNIIGIQDFVGLTKFSISYGDNLDAINLQGNTNLKELLILFNTPNGVLTSPSLNLSNNLQLEILRLGFATNLNLDVTNNINLHELEYTNSFLSSLNVSNNINLKHLDLYNDNINWSLNLSNNLALEYLDLSVNRFQYLDLSTNVNLKYLFLGSNEFQDLTLENNTLLEHLDVQHNNFTTLDVTANTQLRSINCAENNINYFSLNNNSNLMFLYANNNNLTNLTIQNGNNSSLSGSVLFYGNLTNKFSVLNNPNLRCIFVDDVNYCNTNWLGKDTTSNYVSNTAECNLLNTNENIVASKFKLYPNPASDIIHIEADLNVDNIAIYNMFGQLVLETTKKDINVSQLNSGTYIAKIFTEDKMEIVKFVKN